MEEPARRGVKYLSVVAILPAFELNKGVNKVKDSYMRTFSSVCATCSPSSESVGVDLIFASSRRELTDSSDKRELTKLDHLLREI